MKLERNIRSIPHWFFTDGSVPIQVRLLSTRDIRKEKHLHRTMHEYFYVLQGNLELSVSGETVRMERDDMAIVEPGEPHVV
ncbi:MAG: cupin domain-containing protein, partial [bacterium]|nr:cupin domain-containing protein [bacterium]